MIDYKFSKKELVKYRKDNYWRGFWVAIYFLIPFIVFLMIVIHFLTNNI